MNLFRKRPSYTGKRKTIALIANSTWNIYNFRLDLIRRLRNEGFQIIVIAPVDEYIHYLNELKFIRHIPLKKLQPHRKNPFTDLQLLLELYFIFRKQRPDLVLSYTIKPNIFGSLAAKFAGIPSIATLTGLGYTFLVRNWINRIVTSLYQQALKHPLQVVFHNIDDLNYFKKKSLVRAINAKVIPGSGVNINYFKPRLKPNTRKFIFLFIGRLLSDKGLFEMVEAAREMKQWAKRSECWVVGELSPQNPMAIAKEQILSWQQEGVIKYFGRRKDIRPLIQAADVVILPSYREGMPRAILEAMAMAKPILTTDVPGCRETVIHGKNGYLVPPNTVAPLVQYMLQLYQDEERSLQQMGWESRELVNQQFSNQRINQAYVELINRWLPWFFKPIGTQESAAPNQVTSASEYVES